MQQMDPPAMCPHVSGKGTAYVLGGVTVYATGDATALREALHAELACHAAGESPSEVTVRVALSVAEVGSEVVAPEASERVTGVYYRGTPVDTYRASGTGDTLRCYGGGNVAWVSPRGMSANVW
jgi:hypothetical protein